MKEIRALVLAAGRGTRLQPLTNDWPKCMMPIGDRPLLEYWLQTLYQADIQKVLVNLHHHAEKVRSFLKRAPFRNWVDVVDEKQLLGTAGTLHANHSFFKDVIVLLVHADNWCQCNFNDFLDFHQSRRPKSCLISMMTFESPKPNTCGVVETNAEGVVIKFHEKVPNPPGNLANGAVYLLEPEVLQWLEHNQGISDFSTEVIPRFLGRIAIWQNTGIHRDIGQRSILQLAQDDPRPEALWAVNDEWYASFKKLPIYDQLQSGLK